MNLSKCLGTFLPDYKALCFIKLQSSEFSHFVNVTYLQFYHLDVFDVTLRYAYAFVEDRPSLYDCV